MILIERIAPYTPQGETGMQISSEATLEKTPAAHLLPTLTDERYAQITDAIGKYMRMMGGHTSSELNRKYSPHIRDLRLVQRDLKIKVSIEELLAWRERFNKEFPIE